MKNNADECRRQELKSKFCEKYKSKLLPILLPLEAERKRTLRKAIFLAISFFGLAFVFFCLMIALKSRYNIDDQIAGFGTLALIVVGFALFEFESIKFTRNLKDRIMPIICSVFGKLKWLKNPHNTIYEPFFLESAFVKPYDRSSFDDVFKGEYKDVKYQIIEGEFRKVVRRGKRRYEEILFDGVILKVDMNKDFTSHTIIQADTFMHISPSLKLKHTELEDVVFEKKFDVFTNDEIDARYLITTSFMQRLNDVSIAFGASIFKCIFY
ncbi:MAG: DUF3137 domain-containing protein, partial [Candidatus Gastranaerophilales bacterium]|nr:DUF3137 domain-containing protein [Candidatus Gastranaerophilales bacterium]